MVDCMRMLNMYIELQPSLISDVGSPLRKQQSVPVQPQVVPNAPVSTESPVPSRPPAYS